MVRLPEDIEEVVPQTLQDNIFDLHQMILDKRQIDRPGIGEKIPPSCWAREDEIKLIAILLGT